MPIIFLDVLIAVNWVIDYLLLSATARILRLTTKRWRLLLGGLMGGITACLIFLTSTSSFLLLVFHFFSACILIKIAFPFSKVTAFLKQAFVLYCISALFSGVISVLWTLAKSETFYVGNGVIYVDISPLLITVFAVISYAALCLYEYVTRRKAPDNYEYSLVIDDGNGACKCRALYDTGMHLVEPFSGKPVVVVEQTVMEPYLSLEFRSILSGEAIPDTTVTSTRVRLVPYRSLGSNGLLPAFVPKRITVGSYDGLNCDISGTYVALCKGLGRGEYLALIGSNSIERGNFK